ncbi:MAG: SDR family NAD(P)-dependent oxidoreductase [Anaerolineales bacterium]|nr:SDR family NAD(P)-dependent oxidoreductase [Anaerolineales bacterium]
MTHCVVVTGATSGIGLAVAEQLARAGVEVIGIGRSEERCRAAEGRLRRIHPQVRADFLAADLSLLRDVRAAAERVRGILAGRGNDGLAGLANNAGGFTFRPTPTPEGLEYLWTLNYLSAFLLTRLLLPALQTAPAARVVNVSSSTHRGLRLDWSDPASRRPWNSLFAYGRSKLALVIFAAELNRRLDGPGAVQALAADPGLVKTGIGSKGTPAIVSAVFRLWSAHGITADESARGIVRLFLDPSVRAEAGVYWKHGRPASPDPAALDEEAGRRLWEISERMCGIDSSPAL